MHRAAVVEGVVIQVGVPDWTPLEVAIGSDISGWFMWMHEIRLADGSRLHAYKHVTTRRYLHLTEDGRAFDYRVDGRYGVVGLASAITRAFSGWERILPPRNDIRAFRAAVESARDDALLSGR
jgi:hypothetical protein